MEINVTGMCCIWPLYEARLRCSDSNSGEVSFINVHLEWRLSCCHGNAKLESLETECSTSLLEGLVTFYGTQTFMLFVLGQNEDVRIVKRHI